MGDADERLAILPFLDGGAGGANIYEAIGVEPVINCRGTFTIIGGSVELAEVVAAMDAAHGFFVQYDELAEAVGRRLAAVTGAEWGLISSGCAAGLKHVTTACVTGGSPERLIRVPNLEGFDKTQVIVPRTSRTAYDHALRVVGVELVVVDTAEEMERAVNPSTAMIYLVTGRATDPGQPLSLEVMARIAEPRGIPILADAAAENLTIPCSHLERGATVAAYSGGKALCGPQCAGLLLGSKDLLTAAWQASAPHHGPGRSDKIGKEEILGMLAAVEAWVRRDHDAEWQEWLGILERISAQVAGIDTVASQVQDPSGLSNRAPALTIHWDPGALRITGEEVAEDFARNKPRIAVGVSDSGDQAGIRINPSQMQPGDEEVVIDRILRILTEPRGPRSDGLAPATVDISGRWDLTVDYLTGTSRHRLSIAQDGNWIEGSHQSEFSVQDLSGVVEGDEVRLSSAVSRPGDNVPFLFSGRAEGERIAGSIHLGEYLTARFTAVRAERRARRPISIPGGPPLAT